MLFSIGFRKCYCPLKRNVGQSKYLPFNTYNASFLYSPNLKSKDTKLYFKYYKVIKKNYLHDISFKFSDNIPKDKSNLTLTFLKGKKQKRGEVGTNP